MPTKKEPKNLAPLKHARCDKIPKNVSFYVQFIFLKKFCENLGENTMTPSTQFWLNLLMKLTFAMFKGQNYK